MTTSLLRNVSAETLMRELTRFQAEGEADPTVRRLAELAVWQKEDQIAGVYDFVKHTFPYISDPINFELFIHPRIMAENYFSGYIRGGDCISGDSPVWVKEGGVGKPIEVRELLPPNGLYAQFSGMEILTPTGFAPLLSVTRKRGLFQTIHLFDTSHIELTTSHKVVCREFCPGERYKEAIDVSIEDLRKIYPPLEENGGGNYEEGWGWGLFFADGSVPESHTNWRISNVKLDYLERARASFEKLFPFLEFKIHNYPSDNGTTNYGQRKHPLITLGATQKKKYQQERVWGPWISEQRKNFYNEYGTKVVPQFILHGSHTLNQGFLDGYMAGDGSGNSSISPTKLEALCLSSLGRKLGHSTRVRDDRSGHDQIYFTQSSSPHRKLKRLIAEEVEVFDIATATGELVVGDIAVKNCDDHALLNSAMLRSLGYQARILLVDSDGDGAIDHALAQVSTPIGWVNVDTVASCPLGWEFNFRVAVPV